MKKIEDEFIEILNQYQGILHKVNLIYFRNEVDRQDNFQEIIYQLWKSFPYLKNKNSIGSWIYAISINTSLKRIRSKTKIEFHEKMPDIKDNSEDIIEKISQNENLKRLINTLRDLNDVDKSLMLLVTGISICTCVVIFLIIISINRKNDILFLIHNGVLIVFIILTAYYYLKCYWNMNLKRTEKFTVYESLNDQIQMISESGNLGKILGFIIGILLFVSINVYFSAKSYIEALKDGENLRGLLFGFIIGMIVALYIVLKMNKYQKREISKLEYYRDQLLSL